MAGKLSATEQDKFGVDSYYDRGTTKTKANSTLFVAFRDATVKVAAADRGSHCERIFSDCAGYVGVRQVRGLCFIAAVALPFPTEPGTWVFARCAGCASSTLTRSGARRRR